MSRTHVSPFVVRSELSVILLAGLLVGACSSGGDPVQPDPCDSAPPRLEVWGGTRPTFSWAPGCGASTISVDDVTPGGDVRLMWVGGSGSEAVLVPPVQYPEVTPGQVGLPEPLVSGRQYRVQISRSRRTSSTCLLGCATTTLWTIETTFVP